MNEVVDGEHLLGVAKGLKDAAAAAFKLKNYDEAMGYYRDAVATLDAADGKPMLRKEVEQMISMKSVLHSNIAQCLLNQELYRRAVDAAKESLSFDPKNVKALYRRAQAYEKVRMFAEGIADLEQLQNLGGGDLSAAQIEEQLTRLKHKKEEVDAEKREQDEDEAADPIGMEMVRMKKRFDEVVEKYDLNRNDGAASEIADWLTSGEWEMTARRTALKYQMEMEDAYDFLRWIQRGIDFQKESNQNAKAGSALGVSGTGV